METHTAEKLQRAKSWTALKGTPHYDALVELESGIVQAMDSVLGGVMEREIPAIWKDFRFDIPFSMATEDNFIERMNQSVKCVLTAVDESPIDAQCVAKINSSLKEGHFLNHENSEDLRKLLRRGCGTAIITFRSACLLSLTSTSSKPLNKTQKDKFRNSSLNWARGFSRDLSRLRFHDFGVFSDILQSFVTTADDECIRTFDRGKFQRLVKEDGSVSITLLEPHHAQFAAMKADAKLRKLQGEYVGCPATRAGYTSRFLNRLIVIFESLPISDTPYIASV